MQTAKQLCALPALEVEVERAVEPAQRPPTDEDG